MKVGIDHIGVAVVFHCHDGKGNFILSKRSEKSRDEIGRWDPGGGGVELGEPVLTALAREIKEEYDADILDQEFLGMRDVHRVDEKGNKTHWIALDYKVLVDRDQVKNMIPEKHDEIGWFTLDTLPTPTHSQMEDFVERYRKKLK